MNSVPTNSNSFFNDYLTGVLSKEPNILADTGLKNVSVAVEVDASGWTLGFDGAGAAKLSSGVNNAPACTIQMNEKTWEGLIGGNLNVPMAVMTRKIKIKGDVGMAAKLGAAIKKAAKA